VESLRQRELGASQRLPISTEPNWGELMEPVDEAPITDPEVLLTARETDNLDETLANADFNPDGYTFTAEDDLLLAHDKCSR
jgi:hypothetical protein